MVFICLGKTKNQNVVWELLDGTPDVTLVITSNVQSLSVSLTLYFKVKKSMSEKEDN